MKEFLENLEIGEGKVKLSQEEIKSILAKNGQIVNAEVEKAKQTAENTYKATITKLEDQLKDVPDSTELNNLKQELQTFKDNEAKRIAAEKAQKEDETLTNNIVSAFGDKKFTNDYVKNGLIADIKSELKKPENVGKGIKEIFDALTKDKEGLFENPNKPGDMPGMGDGSTGIPNNINEMSYEQYKAWRKNN